MRLPICVALLVTSALVAPVLNAQSGSDAQQGRNASPAKPAPDPRMIRIEPEDITTNVQIEVTVTDYVGSDSPQKKSVLMLVGDGRMGRVRATRSPISVLNVDATPRIQQNGRIALQLSLEYRPLDVVANEPTSPINEVLTVLLQSGKPLVVTQAADPSRDRKVTVEVTATVLK